MSEEEGLKVTILRFFNAYGVRNHPSWWGGPLSVFFEDLLDGRMMEIHGDGRQTRSFTYVSDTVDGVVRALARPETSGEVINIGNDQPIEIIDLARKVQDAMGLAGPLRARMIGLETFGGNYQDVRHRVPDLVEGQAPARLRAEGVARGGPGEDAGLAPRAARGRRGGRRGRVSRAAASAVVPAGGESPRPLLHAVDRSDAALMSIGTLASGVLAYAFNVLAARTLGPAAYGAIGALWGGMFLLAVLLFRPIEQTVSRAVADHVARGEDSRPAVRSAAWLTAVITTGAVAGCVLAWAPITDRLFGGQPVLTVALIAGVVGYALSYFARGLVGGVQWFGGYGLVLLADGAIRFVLALPLLFVASPTVAAVAIAAAAGGGALAPLVSRRRGVAAQAGGPARRARPTTSAPPCASRCPPP